MISVLHLRCFKRSFPSICLSFIFSNQLSWILWWGGIIPVTPEYHMTVMKVNQGINRLRPCQFRNVWNWVMASKKPEAELLIFAVGYVNNEIEILQNIFLTFFWTPNNFYGDFPNLLVIWSLDRGDRKHTRTEIIEVWQ